MRPHEQIHAAITGMLPRSAMAATTHCAIPDVSAGKLLLTVSEGAVFVGVSVRQFYNLVDKPAPVMLGRRCVRYRRADLIAFVAGLSAVVDRLPEPSQLAAGKLKKRLVQECERGHSGGTEFLVAEHQQPRGPKQRIPPSNSKLALPCKAGGAE